MPKRKPIDGDTGETTELDGGLHCFIVRFDDDQFEAVLLHQARLARAVRKPVSRAAAVREIVGRVLPRRKRQPTHERQCHLFGKPLARNPLVGVEAQRVAERAAEKLIKR